MNKKNEESEIVFITPLLHLSKISTQKEVQYLWYIGASHPDLGTH